MNERELGKALVRGDDPIDVPMLTDRVLRSDRRGLWIMGLICVAAWMLVVAIPWGTHMPMVAKLAELQGEINREAGPHADKQQERTLTMLQVAKQGTILTFLFSMVSMLMASICTVTFIVLARRATLRQINARLTEMSNQLRTLVIATKSPS